MLIFHDNHRRTPFEKKENRKRVLSVNIDLWLRQNAVRLWYFVVRCDVAFTGQVSDLTQRTYNKRRKLIDSNDDTVECYK